MGINRKKNSRLVCIICGFLLITVILPYYTTQNARADTFEQAETSWYYDDSENNIFFGYYGFSSEMGGPYVYVEYWDTGEVGRIAVELAYLSEIGVDFVEYSLNQEQQCVVESSGIEYSTLYGASESEVYFQKETDTSASTFWASWQIRVPFDHDIDVYAYVFFEASGLTPATAQLTFGLALWWSGGYQCPNDDDVDMVKAFWIVDIDMGDEDDDAQGAVGTYSCPAYETYNGFDTTFYGVAFDPTPSNLDFLLGYSYDKDASWSYPSTKRSGVFNNDNGMSIDTQMFTDNDNNQRVDSNEVWVGIQNKKDDPGENTKYGWYYYFDLTLDS